VLQHSAPTVGAEVVHKPQYNTESNIPDNIPVLTCCRSDAVVGELTCERDGHADIRTDTLDRTAVSLYSRSCRLCNAWCGNIPYSLTHCSVALYM